MSAANVLVVDDENVSLTRLTKILVRDKFKVTTARDGEDALAVLENSPHPFDALLLDRRMPGMNGLQLLRHLKGTEKFRNIPVIFQTEMNRTKDVVEGLQAGAHYYLTKPVVPKMVLAVVHAAIADCSQHQSFFAEVERTQAAMSMLDEGLFRFQTMRQCHELTTLLAKTHPDPARIVIGISELMINALEHGNLGITFDEKSQLIEAQRWKEEVDLRQQLPEHQSKRVTVRFERRSDALHFEIQDEGQGFDWRKYDELHPEMLFNTHGRGILLARMNVFSKLEYQGCGNRVVADVSLNHG